MSDARVSAFGSTSIFPGITYTDRAGRSLDVNCVSLTMAGGSRPSVARHCDST
jgi:hypothetical protein